MKHTGVKKLASFILILVVKKENGKRKRDIGPYRDDWTTIQGRLSSRDDYPVRIGGRRPAAAAVGGGGVEERARVRASHTGKIGK